MDKYNLEQAATRITEILAEFKEISHGQIKQNTLARLLGLSESTLAKAKAAHQYEMPVNTVKSIEDNLEDLLKRYKEDSSEFTKIRNGISFKKKVKLSKLMTVWGLMLSLFLLISVIFVFRIISYDSSGKVDTSKDAHGEYYSIDFTNKSLDSLLGKEWFFKDLDSTLLEKHKDSVYFTLGTEIGDYYKLHGEETRIEKIKNLLYRKINCGSCCIIRLKISGFHPTEPYQQAGFLLFYSDTINPRYYTRLTYSYLPGKIPRTDSTEILPIFYDYHSKEFILHGPRYLAPKSIPYKDDPHTFTNFIWLRVEINNGIYSFSYRRNRTDWGYTPLNNGKGHDLNLNPPQLIAIGAWQGHSATHSNVYLADTVTVTFNKLIIEPCNDN